MLFRSGRTLPRPLPAPDRARSVQSPPSSGAAGRGEKGPHRVEKEEDPAALFHALMQASPDGQVPPHLLERLRALENSVDPAPSRKEAPTPRAREDRRAREHWKRDGAPGGDDLYTAFAQLLLEEVED